MVQWATPLRLHNDTIVFINMAESAVRGGGFLEHGQTTHFPPGYPAMLAALMKLGIFHVWSAIALNFAFLALGLWATAQLVPYPRAIVILTLLSFVTLKHYSIPLTDLVFFGVAMLCLLMLQRERLLPACFLVLLATAIRHNGIALAPPLVWMLYRRRRVFVLPVIAAVAAASLRITSLLPPFQKTVEGHTLLDSIRQILGFRFLELGEVAVNIPAVALPPAGPAILAFVGMLVLSLIAAGIWMRPRKFLGPVELFFLGYAAILFIWPWYDPRFWLPVLPLLFGYAGSALRRLPSQALLVYTMVFSMIGLAVLAQSIRITFAGADFPEAYGNAQFHDTYCAFYRSCSFDPRQVYPDGLRMLQQYR